ncbi:MAG TPA: type VI secretion system tip protein VgrG [Gaiellaceae bacterium]|nr:type VI secretion system tip protein VgrG [Gaiellaceae bacterium]
MPSRELPLEQTPDLPDFAVKVDGTALERVQRDDVLRIDVHEEVGKLARATLLVRNWDDEKNEVRHSDADTFRPGREIEVQVGYNGELTTVFSGIVVELAADFVSNRQPVLEVVCRCKGALLAGARRSRIVEEGKDGDLVSTVAGDYALTADAADGAEHPFLVQASRVDWDFLAERAAALGLALYVRGDSLVFKPPQVTADPMVTLTWNANLLELRLHEDLEARTAQTTAAAWDPEALEAADAEATAGEAALPAGARPGVEAALGDAGWAKREDRLAHPGPLGPDELSKRAHARVDRNALREFHGAGRSVGLPQLRIDGTIEIAGVGTRFAGRHYVSAVRHTLDRHGYVTEFQLGVPPELRPACCGRAAAPGIVPGIVDDIDDPNGQGRVRVSLPWLDPDIPSVWARLAVPAAGDKRGFFWIPEVGDEVIVGFLGDPSFPVVLGCVWNGQQAPPKTLDASTNAIRSLVSRSGHELTFDDTDGAEMVLVKTKAGQTITVDDASGSETIALQDKSSNKLTLDSKGITLEAASGADVSIKASSGKVSIDCLQLEAKASSTAKLEASATLDIQASATLGLKGALVNIN